MVDSSRKDIYVESIQDEFEKEDFSKDEEEENIGKFIF